MEVTKKNFNEQMENLKQDLKRSCFVSFDAEFTAILSGECFKHRLFDDNEERYNKIKTEVSKMIMTQVGLTIFQYDREHEMYVANGYTFHLCPQTIGNVDQSFIFQASTLTFLCKHSFDFNKFIYEGLPYLSKAEEANIQQQLEDKSLFSNLSAMLDRDDEKQVQSYCSEISKWILNSEEGTMYLDVQNPLIRYIIHNEIRMRFPDVLTTDSLGNSNKVLIYRDKQIEGATSAPMSVLEENLLSYLKGFSQIIDLLSLYKKPIIGHNIFLDLVLIHNQFIGPLPNKYSEFKKNIHNLLPSVYDTKFISNEMRNKLTFDECWKSNGLQDLYEFFTQGRCKKLDKGLNFIKLNTTFNVKQSYHEAGWDSYCSGYCFIRLSHWAACENMGKHRPASPTELLAAAAPYCNRVNIIRGAVPFMNIVGADPPRHRPDILHVKSVKEPVISIEKVASALSCYGVVDVKVYGKRTALVAANSHFTKNKILKEFKNNAEYKISMFRPYMHHPAGRVTIWGGAILTGSLLIYLLHKNVNKLGLNK